MYPEKAEKKPAKEIAESKVKEVQDKIDEKAAKTETSTDDKRPQSSEYPKNLIDPN